MGRGKGEVDWRVSWGNGESTSDGRGRKGSIGDGEEMGRGEFTSDGREERGEYSTSDGGEMGRSEGRRRSNYSVGSKDKDDGEVCWGD